MQDHTNQLPIPVQVVQKNRLCFEIIAFSAASHCGLPTDSQSANNGKSKLNPRTLQHFFLTIPVLRWRNLWVRKYVEVRQTERGNTRGGATKKCEISRTSLPINLHF